MKLLQEFIQNNKQWAKLARIFPGRTQHQIKNRFFALLTKELALSREKLKDLTQKNCLSGVCKLAIEALDARKEGAFYENAKNPKESLFLETTTEENSSFDEVKENSNSFEMEFNFEEFINFEREEKLFTDFP